jgi:endoglucanase
VVTVVGGALVPAVNLAGSADAAIAFSCRVDYQTNDWGTGFTTNVTINNLGTTSVNGWTLTYSYAGNQTLQNGWNGVWSQSGTQVTVANENWNSTVPAKGSVSPGAQFAYSGSNVKPTAFSVNGAPCDGSIPPPPPPPPPPPAGTGPATALHVSGNQLLNAGGQAFRMLGVNRASAEFACVQGKGMWDSPAPDQSTVDAMRAWHIRAVRIPLNEDCWLGLSGTPNGAPYQQAVKDYVNLLVANGINPILDLHWTHGQYTGNASACTDVNATCQKPMPSRQFTPTFWTQVATAFKGNNAVVFDLFNEPFPDAANNFADATASWKCLRDGGTCGGISFPVAGMQELVNAIRATGATNVIMSAGLTWTSDLTQWLTYEPSDPTGNLIASWHSYNFNACVTESCWDRQIAPVAAQVPVMAGEIGQNTCAHEYIDQLMTWLDQHSIGYTAWTWNPWGCGQGNVLIQDYGGTPTSTFGEGYRAHLLIASS